MVQPITRDPEFKIPVPIAGRFPDLQINTPESSSQFPSDCAYTHDSAFPVYSDEIVQDWRLFDYLTSAPVIFIIQFLTEYHYFGQFTIGQLFF